MFCGGFLGFFVAALAATIIVPLLPGAPIAIACGTVTGLAIGYYFPSATEAFWWILSIFS